MIAALTLAIGLLGASHPHLFFEAADVPRLRQQAASTHKPISDNLLAVLNAHLADPAPTTADYTDVRFFGNQVAVWAFAWQITGDARYASKARQILLTYLGWTDWGFGEGVPDLTTGHMLLGVACAYDWLTGWSGLSATEASDIRTRLGAEAQRMYAAAPTAWWISEYVQNHHWINTAGLGLAALALGGEDSRSATWLAYAQTHLQRIGQALGPIADGSFHEGIPYQAYGLSMALPFWTALARTGSDYTDIGMLRGYGHFRLTTGVIDSFRQTYLPYGDFYGWTPEQTTQVLRYTASRFNDGEAEAAAQRWLAAGTRTTLIPQLWYEVFEFLWYDPAVRAVDPTTLPLDAHFPDLQASVLRSSWQPGNLTVAFKGGPYGGRFNFDRISAGGAPGGHLAWGHDHNDDLSFWIHGAGAWLAPEAMGYDAGRNTGYTDWANATSFHNSILVDGQGQLGDARTSDSEWNNPWFWERDATTLVRATGTPAYAVTGGRGPKLFDPALGLSRWDRLVVLSRNRYVLVRDDIAATTSHTWDWVCHFSDAAVSDGTGWIKGTAKSGQGLGVRVIAPAEWTAQTGSQTATLMWKFDADAATSYVRVRPTQVASSQQFLAALVPVQPANWASKPLITPLDAADPGAGLVVAQSAAGPEERWIFSRPGADGKAAGDLALTQGLLAVAARQDGVPVRSFLIGPGKLSDNSGARELLSSHSATSIEAEILGTTLAVSGEGIADFRAYAPGIVKVTLNGATIAIDLASGAASFPAVGSSGGGADGGWPDAGGTADGGARDGGAADGGHVEPGNPDAGADGGGALDAGPSDGGASSKGGVADAGTIQVDASSPIPLGGGCGGCGRGGSGDAKSAGLATLLALLGARRRKR